MIIAKYNYIMTDIVSWGRNNLRYFNYMFKKITFSNYLLFRHIDLSWINTARRKLLSAQLYYNFYDNCIETSSCPSKYIFLERTLLLHRFNSRRTDIRISKLNFRVRWHARRFIFEVLDEGNGTEVRGEGGRMHRVPGCTSCSANSLPSYLASAVVNWIYRSLLANVARKGGLPERTDKKIMWRGEKRQDRIGREDDGERGGAKCGRNWYRVRQFLVASAPLHLEKLVEGAARRARESIMNRTKTRKK